MSSLSDLKVASREERLNFESLIQGDLTRQRLNPNIQTPQQQMTNMNMNQNMNQINQNMNQMNQMNQPQQIYQPQQKIPTPHTDIINNQQRTIGNNYQENTNIIKGKPNFVQFQKNNKRDLFWEEKRQRKFEDNMRKDGGQTMTIKHNPYEINHNNSAMNNQNIGNSTPQEGSRPNHSNLMGNPAMNMGRATPQNYPNPMNMGRATPQDNSNPMNMRRTTPQDNSNINKRNPMLPGGGFNTNNIPTPNDNPYGKTPQSNQIPYNNPYGQGMNPGRATPQTGPFNNQGRSTPKGDPYGNNQGKTTPQGPYGNNQGRGTPQGNPINGPYGNSHGRATPQGNPNSYELGRGTPQGQPGQQPYQGGRSMQSSSHNNNLQRNSSTPQYFQSGLGQQREQPSSRYGDNNQLSKFANQENYDSNNMSRNNNQVNVNYPDNKPRSSNSNFQIGKFGHNNHSQSQSHYPNSSNPNGYIQGQDPYNRTTTTPLNNNQNFNNSKPFKQVTFKGVTPPSQHGNSGQMANQYQNNYQPYGQNKAFNTLS